MKISKPQPLEIKLKEDGVQKLLDEIEELNDLLHKADDEVVSYANECIRLNNIINELEKYLEKTIIDGGTRGSMTFWYRQIYEYLKELKEGVNNE